MTIVLTKFSHDGCSYRSETEENESAMSTRCLKQRCCCHLYFFPSYSLLCPRTTSTSTWYMNIRLDKWNPTQCETQCPVSWPRKPCCKLWVETKNVNCRQHLNSSGSCSKNPCIQQMMILMHLCVVEKLMIWSLASSKDSLCSDRIKIFQQQSMLADSQLIPIQNLFVLTDVHC